MTAVSLALLALLLILMLVLVKPLGLYMANVMEGRPIWALRVGAPLERLMYRLGGIDPSAEMGWKRYMIALLLFNVLGVLVLYALQRLQLWLPLNPQQLTNVSADSSFNTAISFVTNTNWQGYSGESTMSYLTQMVGLAVQNFLSAATGIVVVIALIRGFIRHTAQSIGNFWTDVTRSTLYILLPLSVLLALLLAGQGVVQNFSTYKEVQLVETLAYQAPKADAAGNPLKDASGNPVLESLTTQKQTLPMGPDGLPGGDQAAGDQRWRFHQRQLRASLRESHTRLESPRDAGHGPHPGRPDLYVRPRWWVTPARVGRC